MTSSGTSPLRKFAILVSSVDAVAARQILMQLPTELANQVRQLAANLDRVDAEEREAILAEIREASLSASPTQATAATQAASREKHDAKPVEQTPLATETIPQDARQPANPWTALDAEAILAVLTNERAQVMAVVISQLDSRVAAAVLSRLGPEVSCGVLKSLTQLSEIDDEVQRTVQQQLLHKLEQHQQTAAGKQRLAQHVEQLLRAAPDELREHWQTAVKHGSTAEQHERGEVREEPDESEVEVGRLELGETPMLVEVSASEAGQQLALTSAPVKHPAARANNPWDDFDSLLELPRGILTEVLSHCDSESVLLALAGASPQFMERFRNMLEPADARDVDRRLKSIGALKLSDIDAAQARLVAAAERLVRVQRRSA